MQKFCKFFATLFCNPFLQPHHMKASRSPTPKCYTFLETSHDPQLESQLRCKNFATFFATLFCTPSKLSLPEVLQPSVIPFWKPLMIPNLDPNSDVKILQTFLQPYFATPQDEKFLKSYHQVLSIYFCKPLMTSDLDLQSRSHL